MAASEDANRDAKFPSFQCIIHVAKSVKGTAKPFSEMTWDKVKGCAEKWRNLDGEYAKIARELTTRAAGNVEPTSTTGRPMYTIPTPRALGCLSYSLTHVDLQYLPTKSGRPACPVHRHRLATSATGVNRLAGQ